MEDALLNGASDGEVAAGFNALSVSEPSSGISEEEFTRAIAKATQDIRNGRPVVVSEKIEDMIVGLLNELGPQGMHFKDAYRRRRMAIKTVERCLNQSGDMDEKRAKVYNNARVIVDNKELEEFVDMQLVYRKILDFGVPMTEEDHLRNKLANRRKKQQAVEKERWRKRANVRTPTRI